LSSVALADAARPAAKSDRSIGLWLMLCCGMIFLMVVIGGITRLTESGLSITEWQPVSGVLPPLDAAQWQTEFEKYQAIPQYRAVHPAMTLAEFKRIFFWEYLHRLWGRLIGFAFAAPFVYFLLRGRISRRLAPKLAGLFVLGGLQGALGWYMVASGLSQRVEVSQYRLAAHLLAAVAIYAAMLWVALDLLAPRFPAIDDRRRGGVRRALSAVIGLVLLTMSAGAFVAGLRAGLMYNSFPLMNGGFAPAEYWALAPWYLNWFENPGAAQFDHRLLAEATWVAAMLLWLHGLRLDLPRDLRLALHGLGAAATLQAALGIGTLLLVVPLPLAVAHQAGAMLLLTAAVVARHRLGPGRVMKQD
jgi:cytochrome c oxidase assembly protein subunit 15